MEIYGVLFGGLMGVVPPPACRCGRCQRGRADLGNESAQEVNACMGLILSGSVGFMLGNIIGWFLI